MFGHLPELFIVLVIALIVFGPEKLPEVAANAGKFVREMRHMADEVMNPQEHPVSDDQPVPDDFSTYYYESLARSGEEVPPMHEEDFHHEEYEEEYGSGSLHGVEASHLEEPIEPEMGPPTSEEIDSHGPVAHESRGDRPDHGSGLTA